MYLGQVATLKIMTQYDRVLPLIAYFITAPPDRGWQHNEGLLLLHSFLSLDILVEFSILRFGASAKVIS